MTQAVQRHPGVAHGRDRCSEDYGPPQPLRSPISAETMSLVRVREALALLRDPPSSAWLSENAPRAATLLGFDRVLLSWVEGEAWIPASVHVRNDPKGAAQILAACRLHLGTIASQPEERLVRQARPVVVDHEALPTCVHPNLATAARCSSYVAAPIVQHDTVTGMLHADCYLQQREPDSTDADVLWTFAEGLGQALSRAAAVDSLRRLTAWVNHISTELQQRAELFGPRAQTGHVAAPPPEEPAELHLVPDATNAESATHQEGLTRREIEVLELMAAGHTNAQVAHRLVITEGTVKSHVKRILRKLDAANRAEAVARWMGTTAAPTRNPCCADSSAPRRRRRRTNYDLSS